MKLRTLLRGSVLTVLALVCIIISGQCADVSIQLSMTPAPISRGESMAIAVVINNSTTDALADTTLFAPLPVGVDQWTAKVRIDGGSWESYPANGLITLPSVSAGGQLAVDIQTPVEPGSPGTLTMTAQWLTASGILAEAAYWVNVNPSVDAGPDAIANLGDSITLLDPSAADGGGAIASVHWTDHGAGGSFDDETALNPTYTPPRISGVMELSLTATDEDGGHAVDSLRLRVNAVPLVSVGGELEASESSRLAIGGASASDPDGWISTLVWSDGGAGGTFLPSNDVIDPIYVVPEIPGCEDRIIILSLIGTDDLGAAGTDSLNLLAINTNQLPIVHVPSDQQVSVGQQVELSAIALDEDGWIDSQQWDQVAGVDVDFVVGSAGNHVMLELPAVEEQADVTFRFTATDNCGGECWADVVLTIIPAESEAPLLGTDIGAMRVDLDLFDQRGLPLSPFDVPPRAAPITAKLTVSNTGDSMLTNLEAYLHDGDSIGLLSSTLDPWRSTTGVGEWLQPSWDGAEIVAFVQGTDEAGRSIVATDTFSFFGHVSGDNPAMTVEVTPSVTQAYASEVVLYTFRIANSGASQLSGLSLHDELLGWLDLPAADLLGGESVEIHVPYQVRENDLPGPLSSQAVAVAFSSQGVRVESRASSHIALVGAGAGGGGESGSGERQRSVVISEIAWAGSLSDPAAEWIELANIGSEAVDLSGWVLAWHEKTDVPPPSSQWPSIRLSGWIQPLEEIARGPEDLLFTPIGNGLWSIQDRSWQAPDARSGYMLLERGSDAVVVSEQAGVVYGDAINPYFQLPDAGATLWLLDADGEVVDSANAQYVNRSGWPAGDSTTCATMERIHLDQGDYDENWQTTSGVMTYGQDTSGLGLLATAGMANSLPLALVVEAAALAVAGVPTSSNTSVPIPTPIDGSPPMIQVSVLASGGGGGAASAPSISTTRQQGTLTMTVNLEHAIRGSYFVWISQDNGDTLLLPLAK